MENKTTAKFIEFDRESEQHLAPKPMRMTLDPVRYRARINAAAMRGMQAKVGMFIKFLKLGEDWLVCACDDPKGYPISAGGRAGFQINAATAGRTILKDLKPGKDRWEFDLQKTTHEFMGKEVFKLVTLAVYAPRQW